MKKTFILNFWRMKNGIGAIQKYVRFFQPFLDPHQKKSVLQKKAFVRFRLDLPKKKGLLDFQGKHFRPIFVLHPFLLQRAHIFRRSLLVYARRKLGQQSFGGYQSELGENF